MKKNDERLPKGITRRKDGRYMGRVQYEDEIHYLYDTNLKTLLSKIEDMRYEIKHGMKGKADGLLLNGWFQVWHDDYKKMTVKQTTLNRYTDYYQRYIKPSLGKKKISDIKPVHVQRLYNRMAEKDYSTKTIRDVHNILNNMYKQAINNDVTIKNPCDGVVLPKTKVKDRRVLTIQEQKEVLEEAEGRLCKYQIIVALETGLRAGELQGLTWDDIDFSNMKISVNKTLVYVQEPDGKYRFKYQTPKTKSGCRVIPMTEITKRALKKQKTMIAELKIHSMEWDTLTGFENLVFVNRTGRPRQGIDFRNDLKRIEEAINKKRKEAAGDKGYKEIDHIYPHALRHTFATRCFEAGIEAKTVQKYLGHSTVAMTLDIYTHVTEEKAQKEIRKLERLYEQIG